MYGKGLLSVRLITKNKMNIIFQLLYMCTQGVHRYGIHDFLITCSSVIGQYYVRN